MMRHYIDVAKIFVGDRTLSEVASIISQWKAAGMTASIKRYTYFIGGKLHDELWLIVRRVVE